MFLILWWFLHIIIRFIALYQHILTVCITMTTSIINLISLDPNKMYCTLPTLSDYLYNYYNKQYKLCSVIPITYMATQHNNKISCILPIHADCLHNYSNANDKLFFYYSQYCFNIDWYWPTPKYSLYNYDNKQDKLCFCCF